MVMMVIALLSAACAGYIIYRDIPRLRERKALRGEIRARPATFRAQVDLQADNGWLWVSLIVYGDAFEVTQNMPVFGRYYAHRAQDTRLEMAHGFRHDWIQIQGLSGTGAEPIAIGHKTMNPLLWDVLADAGAHPVGPPPQK